MITNQPVVDDVLLSAVNGVSVENHVTVPTIKLSIVDVF